MADDVIALRELDFRHPGNDRPTLAIPELRIGAGQRMALIGASGAGKSTLLRLLDGRLRGWSGGSTVLGRSLDPDRPPPRHWRRGVGFVFQEFALVERETVRQNVLNGRLGHADALWSLTGRFAASDHAAAERAIRDVGMDEFTERRVDRLSGGQRQRVAIARCLAQEPRIILADEPISSLDPATARAVLELLRDSAVDRGATLVISSHQPQLVAGYVDRFVALDLGRIIFDGSPEAIDERQLSGIYGEASQSMMGETV
jgi:phosphonate transport system ATP-binding protein